MADRFIFQLAEGWALGADDKQWMLLRARKRHAETVWQPVAFIASIKGGIHLKQLSNNVGPPHQPLLATHHNRAALVSLNGSSS